MTNYIRYFLMLLPLLSGLQAWAQPIGGVWGNEWINPSYTYYKIRTWEDGIYRVTRDQLGTAGLDTLAFDGTDPVLYFRGQQVPIYIDRDGGGKFRFMEFYGIRNDGLIDTLIYRNPDTQLPDPDQQPTRHISVFSDTAAYFLTLDAGTGVSMPSLPSTNPGNYTVLRQFMSTVWEMPVEVFYKGGGTEYTSEHLLNSDWTTAEGYTSGTYEGPNYKTVIVPLPRPVNGAVPHNFRVRTAGANRHPHETIITHVSSGTVLSTTLDTAYYIRTDSMVSSVALTSGPPWKNNFYVGAGPGASQEPDIQALCVMEVDYERFSVLDNGGEAYVIDWQRTDTVNLQFTAADVGTEAYLFDMTNNVRIEAVVSNDTLNFVVPGAAGSRRLRLSTDNALHTAEILPTTSLSNLSDTSSGVDYIIISHRSLQQSAERFRTYRDTSSTLDLSAKVVYVDQLYDEFGYGSVTPLAIKRYCQYMLENYSTPPKYVMLWGKGRYITKNAPDNLVPVWGYPANDYEFVGNYDPNVPNIVPLIPIGRMNVHDDDEGNTWLDKLDEYEHTPYDEWMKEAIYLGGGKSTGEQQSIKDAYTFSYRPRIIGDPSAGVSWYWQNWNSGQLTNAATSTSKDYIDRGVGLIHFFGHSSTNIQEIDILDANQYSNFGKYPVMVAFGCYGGDFTGGSDSFGEKFVKEKNRGSIAYLANSTAGFLGYLRVYGQHFYRNIFSDFHGQPMGDAIQETMQDMAFAGGSYMFDLGGLNTIRQMNLQGDPAMIMRLPQRPDLAVQAEDVFITPTLVSAQDNSFDLNIILHNYGTSFPDSFRVSITHRTAGGQSIAINDLVLPSFRNEDTLVVNIQNTLGASLAGVNDFDIFLDSRDSIFEYSETNNRVTHTQIIQGASPAVLLPYEYAIIPDIRTKLAASATIMTNDPNVLYEFQIDTSYTFDQVTSSGPVGGSAVYGEWDVPFDLVAGQVYYWRVRLYDHYPIIWTTSSFKYVPGKSGWAQSRPPQFFKDPTEQVIMDQLQEEWNFDLFSEQLHAFINQPNGLYPYLPFYTLGKFGSALWSGPDGVMYTSIDQLSLEPLKQGLNSGDWAYIPMPAAANDLHTEILSMKTGDYFLLTTNKSSPLSTWSPQTLQILEQIGCSAAQLSASTSERFIIFGRKGLAPGQAVTVLEPNLEIYPGVWRHELLQDLTSSLEAGTVKSTVIGPATDWSEFLYNWTTVDATLADDVNVQIYGIRTNNNESLVYQGLSQGVYTVIDTLNASLFPYLRLEADVEDSIYRTAPSLTEWQVLYESAPDAAVDPVFMYEASGDTIEEGQPYTLNIGATNVSDKNMDSLLVRFAVERADRSVLVLHEERLQPLAAGQSMSFGHTFNSALKGLEGRVTLLVEINPDKDQPELYEFNNVFYQPLYVKTDKIGPILEVTVDGKHLIDGDLVSPNPEIVVEINDENAWLPVTVSDTTFGLWFGPYQSLSLLEKIDVSGSPLVESIPARLPQNKARLYFRPGPLDDGDYTLRVSGYDFKGNSADTDGDDYVIRFTVTNEKAVSKVLPYPNPFSTRTRFAYTLTGGERPYEFQIRIFTITGKLIKVIDLADAGDVHFGYNISESYWDGTDDFGDPVANGVYIYETVIRFESRDVEERDEGIDQYFNKGFGKIYLMR